jgi:hypothetical protein
MMEYMEQQMQNQIEAAENEREQMLCEIVKLEQNLEAVQAERDALAAQVELLRSWLRQVAELINLDGGTAIDWLIDTHQEMLSAAKSTPAACLAQVRAEAVVKAANECNKYSGDFCAHSDLLKHAERIQQEVK